MNNIMIFENKKVEVFELNGQVLFNPYDVGVCLGLTDSAVRKAIGNMNEKQVIKLTNSIVKDIHFRNSIVQDMNFRKLHNTGENFLTESGVYKLIFKSNKEEAERFQDWVTDEVLPVLRKTGTYSTQPTLTTKVGFKEQMEVVDIVANSLKVNNASRVLMYKTICEENNVSPKFLPSYTDDNNNKILKSATELLKLNDLKISTIRFNKLLKENGYLEEKTRPSSKGKIKKFNALTGKGLEYGENLANVNSPKEVQPLYYENSFLDLINVVCKDEVSNKQD